MSGHRWRLQVPTSLAERWDIYGCSQTHPGHRALAAALALSCSEIRRRHPYDGRPGVYGGIVFDALLAAGVPQDEIFKAGEEAVAAACAQLVDVGGAGPSGASRDPAPAGADSEGGSSGGST